MSEPWYPRAFELFREQHFDTDAARLLALDELRQRQRNDIDERPSSPPGRMVGIERNG